MDDVDREPPGEAAFLTGGGEMGALMRAHDWRASPLGDPSTWPSPLRTAVALMLGAAQPVYIAWGAELTSLYNDGYLPIVGDKHSGLGLPFRTLWAEIWDQFRPIVEATMTGAGQHHVDLPIALVGRPGVPVGFFTFSYTPLRDEEGRIAGFYVAATETTQAVLAERRQAFLLAIEERLRGVADPAEVMAAAAELLGKHLGVSRVGYAAIDGSGEAAVAAVERDWTDGTAPSIIGRHPLDQFGAALATEMRAGRTIRVDDMGSHPLAPPEVARAFADIGVGAAITPTLVKDDRPAAVLFVHAAEPRRWTDDEVALVEDVAERTWSAVQRARAEAVLRESEARLARALDAGALGAWKLELSTLAAWRSQQHDRIFGHEALLPEWTYETFLDHVVPEDRGWVDTKFQQAIASGGRWDFECRIRSADGKRRWIWAQGQVDSAPGGRPGRMKGMVRDVTDRKRAEERLRTAGEAFAAQAAEREAILGQLAEGVIVTDRGGRITFVNEAAERLHGVRLLGVAPDDYTDAYHLLTEAGEPYAPRALPLARAVLDGETVEEARWRIRRSDGSEIVAIGSARPIVGEGGDSIGAVLTLRDDTARTRAEAALSELNETLEAQVRERTAELLLYRNIVESDRFPICAYDTGHRVTAFNKAHADNFLRVMGRPARLDEVLPDLFPPEQAAALRAFAERALAGETFTVEADFGDPDMTVPHWELDFAPVRDEAGTTIGAFHHARDVTERLRTQAELRAAQEQLRQSQKMEAVGQLTGGLAHDFNNLLAGISGSLELIGTRIAQGRLGDVDRYRVAAQGAAKRAAALTHRLLAFSRRQTLEPKPTDLNRLMAGMEDLIRHTMGPAIDVEAVAKAGLWPTLVDPNQLENALLNLCINARDAMPDGGKLTIETANRWLDERAARERDLPPGQYVSLCVSDNGMGMTPDVAEKAFDPFFTTKPIGQGTGLGLSMIYGFVRQSGGQVRIYSEVGQGTMVCLYLPRHHGQEIVEAPEPVEAAEPAGAGETVLVIDDEPLVRMLVVDVLDELGYTAIEAGDGPEGLKALRSEARIDLLITDVGLPGGMNGRQVAEAARALRPGLQVLFVTGYAENAVLSHGHLAPGMQVVTKPFDIARLASRIREMIASR